MACHYRTLLLYPSDMSVLLYYTIVKMDIYEAKWSKLSLGCYPQIDEQRFPAPQGAGWVSSAERGCNPYQFPRGGGAISHLRYTPNLFHAIKTIRIAPRRLVFAFQLVRAHKLTLHK